MTAQLAFWGTGLALAIVIALGARGGAGRIAILTAAAAPAVLIVACLLSTSNFGDFRLRVTGLTASRAALGQPVGIGGDAAADDLLFTGLPPRLLTIGRSPLGMPEWRISAHMAGDRAGVVEVETADGGRHLVGSNEMLPGDIVCVMQCGTGAAVSFRLAGDGRRLERVGASEALPAFHRRPFARFLNWEVVPDHDFWAPGVGIYPLRDYGVPWRGTAGALQPCRRRQLCLADGRTPVRSFLYSSNGLRVMLLDPGAQLTRGNRIVNRRSEAPVVLDSGLIIAAVRLYTVSYGDAYADPVAADRPPSRLRWVGGLRPVAEGDSVRLDLLRARTTPIERPEVALAAERATLGRPVPLTILGAAGADGPSTATNPIHLGSVGGVLRDNLRVQLLLDEASGYGRSGKSFALAGQQDAVTIGKPFTLGSTEPLRQVRLVLERLDVPRLMLLIAPFWAFLLCWTLFDLWRQDRAALVLVATVQWLLALRFLIGVETAYYDPALRLSDSVGGNIAAYVAVPLILAAAADSSDRRVRLIPAFVFAAAVIGAVFLLYGNSAVLQASGLLVLLALPMIVAPQWRRRAAMLVALLILAAAAWSGLMQLLIALGIAAAAALVWNWRSSLAARISARPAASCILIILLLVAGRIGLQLFGVNERLTYNVNLSIVYVPVLLLAFAGLFAAMLKREPEGESFARSSGVGLATSLLLLVAFGAIALAGDIGFGIYAIALVMVGSVLLWRRSRAWTLGWLALPAGAMAAVLLWIAVGEAAHADRQQRLAVALQDVRSPEPQAQQDASARVAAILGEMNKASADELRLLVAIAPDRAAMAGTTAAENLRRVGSILSDYTSERFGRGYMHPSDPGEIRAYQADDNVSAVHLMSPFGRVGGIVLLLLLGVLAVAGWRATDSGFDGIAARLALWTVFAAAAYMILANLQLVPFTGRNIYFLAARSGSDLIEGLLLFLIALRGIKKAA